MEDGNSSTTYRGRSILAVIRMNISNHMFLYFYENRVYATTHQPDGSVRARKLSVHTVYDGSKDKENKSKRIFTIPKYFFPNVTENNKILFSLDKSEVERFSKVNATLTIEVI